MTNKGLFPRLVLATVLAVGFLCVWGVIGVWAVEVWQVLSLVYAERENLSFRTEGTAVRIQHDGRGNTHYRDLEGNLVTLPEDKAEEWLHGTRLPASLPLSVRVGDIAWEDRIRSFDDGRRPAVRWHFIGDGQPRGEAYFVGYDSQSKECVGYLGTTGFRGEMPTADERFPFAGAMSGRYTRVFCPERKPGQEHTVNPRDDSTVEGALSP